MTVDRLSVALAVIAEDAGDGSVVDRVCVAAVSLLALSGAGLSLLVNGELRGSAGVTGPGIAAVQELQLSLGEGPCLEAWAERSMVLEPDLADPGVVRWPAFAQAGLELGVRAVFVFPMTLGAIRVGMLVLYRDCAGGLTEDQLAYGFVLADVATQVVLALQAAVPPDTVHALLATEPPHWATVHQATGMVSVQLAVPLGEAFARLQARAFATDTSLRSLARRVLDGQEEFVE